MSKYVTPFLGEAKNEFNFNCLHYIVIYMYKYRDDMYLYSIQICTCECTDIIIIDIVISSYQLFIPVYNEFVNY